MSRLSVRPVVFEDWKPWDERRQVSGSPSRGGVYLLAHCSDGAAPAKATPESLPREVVYVGITKDLATRPANGHEGVKQYHKRH